MLVLSRQRDETIMIGDEIMITVVDIRGDKVRLGITAPTSIAVHRKEVYEAIKAENQRAALIAGTDAEALKTAFASGARRPARGPGLSPTPTTPPASHPKPRLTGAPAPTTLRPPMPVRLEGTG
jgi:carbon storage regulator